MKTNNISDPNLTNRITSWIDESVSSVSHTKNLINEITKTADLVVSCLKSGHKIITLGNGGSAADAQHLAAEFIGRYLKERISLPAISLTTDTSIITAIGNDYGFDYVFSRQCESIVNKDDVVIAFSTSGKSKNVINALLVSKNNGAHTICLTGELGTELRNIVDVVLIASSKSTPRIQEVHRILMHIICQLVEEQFEPNDKK